SLGGTEGRQQHGTGSDDDPGRKRVRGSDAQHVAPPEFGDKIAHAAEYKRPFGAANAASAEVPAHQSGSVRTRDPVPSLQPSCRAFTSAVVRHWPPIPQLPLSTS